jgi:hypothetical protein
MNGEAGTSRIGRRELIGASILGLGLAASAPAQACSLTAQRLSPYSDRECRRKLRLFVDLLNEGPQLSAEAISERAANLAVSLDNAMVEEAVGNQGTWQDQRERFYREFRLSGGKLDPRPIRLHEANLIRRLGNHATYQFTLERYSYHEADPEGCNGMFVHDEFYGVDRISYLATFTANILTTVKLFPEWPLEARA